MRGYPVRVYQEDDGSWAAEVPDLPGCVAGGDNPAEPFEMLADAMNEWIASTEADGARVPVPSRRSEYSGRFITRTPPSLHEQLAWRAELEGMSLNSVVLVALTAYVNGEAGHDPIQWPRSHAEPIFEWPDPFTLVAGGMSRALLAGSALVVPGEGAPTNVMETPRILAKAEFSHQ